MESQQIFFPHSQITADKWRRILFSNKGEVIKEVESQIRAKIVIRGQGVRVHGQIVSNEPLHAILHFNPNTSNQRIENAVDAFSSWIQQEIANYEGRFEYDSSRRDTDAANRRPSLTASLIDRMSEPKPDTAPLSVSTSSRPAIQPTQASPTVDPRQAMAQKMLATHGNSTGPAASSGTPQTSQTQDTSFPETPSFGLSNDISPPPPPHISKSKGNPFSENLFSTKLLTLDDVKPPWTESWRSSLLATPKYVDIEDDTLNAPVMNGILKCVQSLDRYNTVNSTNFGTSPQLQESRQDFKDRVTAAEATLRMTIDEIQPSFPLDEVQPSLREYLQKASIEYQQKLAIESQREMSAYKEKLDQQYQLQTGQFKQDLQQQFDAKLEQMQASLQSKVDDAIKSLQHASTTAEVSIDTASAAQQKRKASVDDQSLNKRRRVDSEVEPESSPRDPASRTIDNMDDLETNRAKRVLRLQNEFVQLRTNVEASISNQARTLAEREVQISQDLQDDLEALKQNVSKLVRHSKLPYTTQMDGTLKLSDRNGGV